MKFKSSNSKVATIDKNGLIVAKKAGKTTISATASLSGITTQCEVVVQGKATQIEFNKNLFLFYKNEIKDNWKGKEDKKFSKEVYSSVYEELEGKYGDYQEPEKDRGKSYNDLGKRIVTLKYKTDTGKLKEKFTVHSDSPYVAEYNPKITGKEVYGEIKLIIHLLGIANITIKTESGLEASCAVYVGKERIKSIEPFEENFRLNLAVLGKETAYTIPLQINKKIPGKLDYGFGFFNVISSNEEVVEIVDYKYFKLKKPGKSKLTIFTQKGKTNGFEIEVYNDPNEVEENNDPSKVVENKEGEKE